MKNAYRNPRNMRGNTQLLLEEILKVVTSYQSQGYTLTLRQLYYQLVVQNIFANLQKNYAKLSDLLGEARMTGLCDWDVIEDRIRVPRFPNEWADIEAAMETLIAVYRRQRWIDQDRYVEVWVEKDALSGVLEPITRDFHVHLLVNLGYSSISAMHDSALRFRDQERHDKECHLLYFGDHDPSGEDMVRDIIHRLEEFRTNVDVQKIALTIDQVEEYKLPPNPAKTTDPRSRGYIETHGDQSWELDALPPATLNELLTNALEELLDRDKYDAQIELEETDKEEMATFGKEHADDKKEGEDQK
jgi:hypothetical protein